MAGPLSLASGAEANSSSESGGGRWEKLEELNWERFPVFLPALVLLVLVAVIGLVGNSLVLHVYGSKLRSGTNRCFVLSLAVVDLLTCTIGVAGEVALLRFNSSFEIDSLCRLITFIKGATIFPSAYIIVLMTIERYRRLCRITRKPLGERGAWLMVGGACLLGVLSAAPYLALSGTQDAPTPWPHINASECVTAHSRNHPALLQTLGAVLLLAFIACFTIIVVLYGRIALMVWRRRFALSSPQSCASLESSSALPEVQITRRPSSSSCCRGGVDAEGLVRKLLCCRRERGSLLCKRREGCSDSTGCCCCLHVVRRSKERGMRSVQEAPSSDILPRRESNDVSSPPSSPGDLVRVVEFPAETPRSGTLSTEEASRDVASETSSRECSSCKRASSENPAPENGNVPRVPDDVSAKAQTAAVSKSSELSEGRDGKPRDSPHHWVASPELHTDQQQGSRGGGGGREALHSHPTVAVISLAASADDAQLDTDVDSGVSTRRVSGRGGRHEDTSKSSTPSPGRRGGGGGARGGRTTLIIFAIGLTLILCYLPFLVAALVRDSGLDVERSLAGYQVYNFFLRSYFAQAAVDPIIYGFLNVTFRTECKKLFSRVRRN